jgi:lipoprotein-releasing system permease protein
MPYEVFLALRYLRYHRGRTFLSVITLISAAGVTVGTAALIVALSLNAGFVQDIRARIHSGSAHLTVMAPRDGQIPGGYRALLQRIEQVEGVHAVAPLLYTPAMLTRDDSESSAFVEVHGIDPAAHAAVVLADTDADPFAPLLEGDEQGGIVLGEDLAYRLGVIEGDRVRVLVPRVTLTPFGPPLPRSRLFEVRGSYHSDHFEQDSQRAYVSLTSADHMLRAAGGVSWVEVALDDLRQLETMKDRLQAELGGDWLVVDLLEQNEDLLKALRTEKLLLFLAIGLIVVVASMNIVSTLILMVTDKLKEIGTLTAMGASPRGIAAVFMLQGLVIGVVGTTIGLGLGSGLSLWLDRYEMIPLNPDVYYLSHLPFALQPMDVTLVGLAALLISFVATIYPATKAARLDPVEAIRHE